MWYINPSNQLRRMTYQLCYIRGMYDASRDILCILSDRDLDTHERLQEVLKYAKEGVMYHPRKPMPVRKRYLPQDKILRGDELLIVGCSDEEPRHGYILGGISVRDLVSEMIEYAGERTDEEVYNSIVTFCDAIRERVDVG